MIPLQESTGSSSALAINAGEVLNFMELCCQQGVYAFHVAGDPQHITRCLASTRCSMVKTVGFHMDPIAPSIGYDIL
jgi:hypothetical protein